MRDLYCSLLAVCFNVMFVHGYVPVEATQTVICPTVKDKNGDLSDISNYRPIALATIFFKKNLEHALLNRLHEYLITSDNQFQTSPLYIDAYPDTQGALKILSRPWKYYVRVLFKCQ